MPNALFITGTDTDAGKTIVTAGLLRALRQRGIDAVPMKPIQTGATQSPNPVIASEAKQPPHGISHPTPRRSRSIPTGRSAPDLDVHLAAAKLVPPPHEIEWMAPYLYEPACSPHLAGRMAGHYPDIAHIQECAANLSSAHDVLLVEGAGGIYAPINEEQTMLDLMKALGYPVLLVARRGLGTINHALLSIEALRHADLEVAGIVFTETEDVERDFIRIDNPGAVRDFGKVDLLGDIDFLETLDSDPDAAWTHFEDCAAKLIGLWNT